MNFKEYKESSTADKTAKNCQNGKNPEQKLNKGAERLLKNFVKDYEGKSREEILAEVLELAKKNRREGKLSDADVDNFYLMLAPMLDKSQVEMLDEVVKEIKAIK